jgi:hypothetical protein
VAAQLVVRQVRRGARDVLSERESRLGGGGVAVELSGRCECVEQVTSDRMVLLASAAIGSQSRIRTLLVSAQKAAICRAFLNLGFNLPRLRAVQDER